MRTDREFEEFEAWYGQNGQQSPRIAVLAFAGMQSDVDLAGLQGDNVARRLPRGTLLVWRDRLVFLRRSAPGAVVWTLWILAFAVLMTFSMVVGFYTNRTPVIIVVICTVGLVWLMMALYQRKIDTRSASRVLAAAEDEDSLFIALSAIRDVKVTERENILLRPHLTLLEVTFLGKDGRQEVAVFASRKDRLNGKADFNGRLLAGMLQARPQ